jgi:phosphatidylglycerophosphate synthase
MAEQEHPILRKIPTALSSGRLIFGLWQDRDLLTTDPKERTWLDAGVAAGVAITDKIDGAMSRAFGSTKHGAFIDRLADVSFSEGGRLSLAKNGEMSPIHPVIGLSREVIVHVLRQSAAASDRKIAVGNRGRQKTTANMLMVVAARSPLSRRTNLIESMASFGSALSFMSGIGYAQEFFSRQVKPAPEAKQTSSARNGGFRKALSSPNDRMAEFITPDHLTRLGEALVEASVLVGIRNPQRGVALAIGPYTLGGLIDGWDGNLARLKGSNSLEGMLKDVRADKRQEIITAAGNSLLASRRDNGVAASHYAVATMTAALPAFFRAAAEANGHIVSEDASGSRAVRGIEGGVGLGLNGQSGVSSTVSALMVTGNIITAAQRADVMLRGNRSPHYRGANDDLEFRNQAAARRDSLIPFIKAGAALGAGLLIEEHVAFKK